MACCCAGPSDDDPHERVRPAGDRGGSGHGRADPGPDPRADGPAQRLPRAGRYSFEADAARAGRRRAAGFLDRPAAGRGGTSSCPPTCWTASSARSSGSPEHCDELQGQRPAARSGAYCCTRPPGTGKTHAVRYLIGGLPDVTAIVISGAALRFIGEACAIAATLQPSIVVVEDVELAAEPRAPHAPLDPLLLRLLNEMEGLSDDANVTFLLTTDRADLLEEALAARPGPGQPHGAAAAAGRRGPAPPAPPVPGRPADQPGQRQRGGVPDRRGERLLHPGTAPPRGRARGRRPGRPGGRAGPGPRFRGGRERSAAGATVPRRARSTVPRRGSPAGRRRTQRRRCGSAPGT